MLTESPLLERAETASRRLTETLTPERGTRRGLFWTAWLFVSLLGILILWDVLLAHWDPSRPNTWSEVARHASRRLPILPWCLGAMVGHLFHGREAPVAHPHTGKTLMALFSVLVGLWSVVLWVSDGVVPVLIVAGTALAGVVASYRLWPLHRPGGWGW